MEIQEIKLKIQTVDNILKYLGTRPYQEVAHLINAIQSEAQPQLVQEPAKKDSTEKKK